MGGLGVFSLLEKQIYWVNTKKETSLKWSWTYRWHYEKFCSMLIYSEVMIEGENVDFWCFFFENSFIWSHSRSIDKLQKYKEFSNILQLDFPTFYHIYFYHFLSLYMHIIITFPELLERKLQTWCPFTSKYFNVSFPKKQGHSPSMIKSRRFTLM